MGCVTFAAFVRIHLRHPAALYDVPQKNIIARNSAGARTVIDSAQLALCGLSFFVAIHSMVYATLFASWLISLGGRDARNLWPSLV